MHPSDTAPKSSRFDQNEVAITGYAVRLPQAKNIEEFWQVLTDKKCVITEIGADRFSKEQFYHPDPAAKGKTYSVAAGQLDNIWGFDAGYFGISPREAEQMDPQQRLLAEVTVEALAEAGLTSDNWDRTRTGVFIGASSSDYSTSFMGDPDAVDSAFMLGNTLSIISNRLSYIFDLKGPSYTVDTACSSSLYALDQAVIALRSGKIDTAIVGAVNLLLSPIPFIGFSRASMLSPDGLCKAFDASANGYVRSEGAVVVVLRRMDVAQQNHDKLRGVIHATAVNSDGRTVGMSMPSSVRQQELLQDIRAENPFDLNDLAFVEAHGTGTAVGDPLEAHAIGQAFAKGRGTPLTIGSAKSNFGHLEPASGLVGLLKSVLALERGLYPASLHISEPNPNIAFDDLNLSLAQAPLTLPHRNRPWLAGVNSFGFGGANAHVVLRQLWNHEKNQRPDIAPRNRNLVLSAASELGLQDLAKDYLLNVVSSHNVTIQINNANYRREILAHAMVAMGDTPAKIATSLETFLANGPDVVQGQRVGRGGKVGFVFSGNGAHWAGMARDLYHGNPAFRMNFDNIAQVFRADGSDDLTALLFDKDFECELGKSVLSQPLVFAIQAALSDTLCKAGLVPDATAGHSAGEVPAAYAAGILTLEDAVHLVRSRSVALSKIQGKGAMAAVLAGKDVLAAALTDYNNPDIELAGDNSARSTTISGPTDALKGFARFARKRRLAVKLLDISHPFHSSAVDEVKDILLEDISDISAQQGNCAYYSATTGGLIDGAALGANYWWKNARNPVRFREAVAAMVADGIDTIIEISPKSILKNYVLESVESGQPVGYVATLGPKESKDIVEKTVARALVLGVSIDKRRFFGPEAAYFGGLPLIPWQRRDYRESASASAIDTFGRIPVHPLLGGRLRQDENVWHVRLDPAKITWLADHVIDGSTVFPATAFIEMAIAAGQQIFDTPKVEISDFTLLRPVVFQDGKSVDLRTSYEPSAQMLRIETRKSGSAALWELCCFGTLRVNPVANVAPIVPIVATKSGHLYENLSEYMLQYGPEFALVRSFVIDDKQAEVALAPTLTTAKYWLDPRSTDAALHGLFAFIDHADDDFLRQGGTMIPESFRTVRVFVENSTISGVVLTLNSITSNGLHADISLCDNDGNICAQFLGLRLKRVQLKGRSLTIPLWKQEVIRLTPPENQPQIGMICHDVELIANQPADLNDAAILFDTAARCVAHHVMLELSNEGRIDLSSWPQNDGQALALTCLELLAEDHLATQSSSGDWMIDAGGGYPEFTVLLSAILARAPEYAVDLRRLLDVKTNTKSLILNGLDDKKLLPPPPNCRPTLRWCWAAMDKILNRIMAAWPKGKRLNILVAGGIPLSVLEHISSQAAADCVIVTDLPKQSGSPITSVSPEKVQFLAFSEAVTKGPFDLIVSVDGFSAAENRTLTQISAALADGGELVVLMSKDSALDRLKNGQYQRSWDTKSVQTGLPIACRISADVLANRLVGAGFGEVSQNPTKCAENQVDIILARSKYAGQLIQSAGQNWKIISTHLKAAHDLADQIDASVEDFSSLDGQGLDDTSVVYLAGAGGITSHIKPLHAICAAMPKQVWIVTIADTLDLSALRGMARVLINEYPDLDIRILSIPIGTKIGTGLKAAALTSELELSWDGENLTALRIMPDKPVSQTSVESDARTLGFARHGRIDSLEWQASKRVAPQNDQVEIKVFAAGLNFRDVMWTQGLLPAEALENGFVGATLGMECAGEIIRIGPDASFSIGEKVICFAPAAFSSHVTVSSTVVARVPNGMAAEIAASLPVSFFTAAYALEELARLQSGETVLIHGAAGGVGLAALQVAHRAGAKVIATAGSPEKRLLLRELGAETVLDSRSLGFTEDVRLMGGVDVVLNSLAGEAMMRSLDCLKPFGRFVELGKRDFFANSRIGLKPFRKNLSYFGMDADQLLSARPEVVRKIFAGLQASFSDGTLVPPPCQVFDAVDVADAFRLMQKSGHIGKIVVRAPKVPAACVETNFIARDAWLIIGGTGGLGLKTAKWLAARGVKKLWLVSRSGKVDASVDLPCEVVNCDASDASQMRDLFAKIAADETPLRGIIHAAMVLDDRLFCNSTEKDMAPVFQAKIDVGRLLDQMSADLPLDHFIVFSSISTFFGNPGQAAYVAANSYLEALMEGRCKRGLAGTAIALGPIADHGHLSRATEQRDMLQKKMGDMLNSDQALNALETVVRRNLHGIRAVGPMAWGVLAPDLKLLRSPYFERIDLTIAKVKNTGGIDLSEVIKGLSRADAVGKVTMFLLAEVAEVLRQPVDEIDPDKALTDLGFDSLMAMSFRMQTEENLGISLPLMALVDGLTLTQLVHKVIDDTGKTETDQDELIGQHVPDPDQIDAEVSQKLLDAASGISTLTQKANG
ncbi:MAG: SDR family NAD(P)-dependent oxidoreductase [Rhodobacteraceae bacterium]|nr:SDR family NAD(P)-dependent oxidoreductase [Paracoccaceae bacterium]